MQNAESLIPLTPLILGLIPQVSATELGQWLICATCVVVMVNQGADFWRKHLKEKPPPADTYVNKTVCKILHIGLDKKMIEESERIKKSEANTETLRREIKDDVKGIHERINAILEAVGQLKGKSK